jgi:rhodanese-related sulfurtransferase
MLRRTLQRRQTDRRTRHHLMLDNALNPREYFNWHPREFKPYHYDKHQFLFEQQRFAQYHHLLCHQVYLQDLDQLVRYPEPHTWIIDCRMEPEKMHRWVPHSHWLPRDEIEYALQLTGKEFAEMYGMPKPSRDEDVILISHDGLASEQVGWEFKKAYFHHVYNYRGGTNELFGETYKDFPEMQTELKPWKGPFPQQGFYTDNWTKKKLLTRTGPFDRQYEMQDFQLPDLELEKARHPEGFGHNMPYGLR